MAARAVQREEAREARLLAVLAGEPPESNAERLRLARVANDMERYAAAARLWAEAMDNNPELADDRGPGASYRYKAARAAALAGCGQGKDDPPPDEAAKAELRRQALGWLRAERDAWEKVLRSGAEEDRATVVKTLQHWRQDPALAGVRDEAELAKLPEAERAEWQVLWGEVAALLRRAEAKADPPAEAAER